MIWRTPPDGKTADYPPATDKSAPTRQEVADDAEKGVFDLDVYLAAEARRRDLIKRGGTVRGHLVVLARP